VDFPLDLALSAFGVPATVTPPSGAPVQTTGFWVTPLTEDVPVSHDFTRREPRRVFVLPRSAVGVLPRGTRIDAVEYGGTVVRAWQVDGIERMEADHVRAIVTVA